MTDSIAYLVLSTLLRPETGFVILCGLALSCLVTGVCLIVRR